ncbi:MAG: RNA-binding protein [candidate division Zixibacteria bacterium]|nr:RNA-binding protein [candidate division Zixibacteria bacterium]
MKIYVGGLAPEVDDGKLKDLFTPYGQVESAVVVKGHYTRQSRGFGFVEMPVRAEASAAITALSGTRLMERALEVSEARPPADRPPHGDRKGGGSPRRGRPDGGNRH